MSDHSHPNQHKMRRGDRALSRSRAYAILEGGNYGVLSTASRDGEPYGVPLNYCVIDEEIAFHCAREGRKIEHLRLNPRASFCVVGQAAIQPEAFTTYYRSCIVQGPVREASADEKRRALRKLVRKYAGSFQEQGEEVIDRLEKKTRVFFLKIEHITGKANQPEGEE